MNALAAWIAVEPDLFLALLDLVLPGAGLRARLPARSLLPAVDAVLVPGVSLPIQSLTAVLLVLWLFLVRRPIREIGFTLHLRWRDVRAALIGWAAFAVVGLPLGLGIGFVRYAPRLPGLREAVVGVVGGYLLVALPEEVLFRGVIQNLLAQRWKRRRLALLVASAIFGLAHLNSATPGFPVPNWAYAGMAALAGIAYGWVRDRTGKPTASAIAHMLVNLFWAILSG